MGKQKDTVDKAEASTSASPVAPAPPEIPQSPQTASGSAPHVLLCSSPSSAERKRKSRSVDADTSTSPVIRESTSISPAFNTAIASRISPTYPPASPLSSVAVGHQPSLEAIEPSGLPGKFVMPSERKNGAENTLRFGGSEGNLESLASADQPPAGRRLSKATRQGGDGEGNRLSFSSLLSYSSAIYSNATGASDVPSVASSNAGSLKSGTGDPSGYRNGIMPQAKANKADLLSGATTATDPISVTTSSQTRQAGLTFEDQQSRASSTPSSLTGTMDPPRISGSNAQNVSVRNLEIRGSNSLPRLANPVPDRRSRSRTQRRPSGSTIASSASPNNTDRGSQGNTSSVKDTIIAKE